METVISMSGCTSLLGWTTDFPSSTDGIIAAAQEVDWTIKKIGAFDMVIWSSFKFTTANPKKGFCASVEQLQLQQVAKCHTFLNEEECSKGGSF